MHIRHLPKNNIYSKLSYLKKSQPRFYNFLRDILTIKRPFFFISNISSAFYLRQHCV